METIKKPIADSPNYMKIAHDCFQLDCGTWYTQEAQLSFAKYLYENKKAQVSFADLSEWKKINKIN